MFAGFEDERVDVGDAVLRVRYGGSGPAILLVHGHPRTGAAWHRVAPLLVERGFTVVCPDMRGYGASTAPPPRSDHAQQSKRAVASDLVRLMGVLGHERFALAGHDRGCYVALRLALDHPDRVTRLAVLDGVPISEALARITPEFATAWFHWFFFAQPDVPERVINADPDAWYSGHPDAMGAENHAEFRKATRDPATVRAMLEDYRAGLGLDRGHELEDRAAGRQVGCPTLFLWSTRDDLHRLYDDPLAIWRTWAPDVRGAAIESGHHMAEESPQDLAAVLGDFCSSTGSTG